MYASVETKKPLYAMPDHFNFTRTFFPVNDCKNGFGLIGTNDAICIVYAVVYYSSYSFLFCSLLFFFSESFPNVILLLLLTRVIIRAV